jgi:hypothetical protein
MRTVAIGTLFVSSLALVAGLTLELLQRGCPGEPMSRDLLPRIRGGGGFSSCGLSSTDCNGSATCTVGTACAVCTPTAFMGACTFSPFLTCTQFTFTCGCQDLGICASSGPVGTNCFSLGFVLGTCPNPTVTSCRAGC